MSSPSLGRPQADEFSGPFANYIVLVPEERILEVLVRQTAEILALLEPLDERVANTVHPPYTWTIKEVVGHLTDCERVFAYRALRAARGDATALAGFDENLYAQRAHHATFAHADLVAEFKHVREASLYLFRLLDDEAWLRRVTATGASLSVRAWAYVIAGHVRHHLSILKRRLGRD